MENVQENKFELVASQLNDLLNINCERVKGYRKALIQCSSNSSINSLLAQRIRYSTAFIENLREEILTLNGRYSFKKSYAAKLHRLWMDAKAFLFPENDISILSSCQFGDTVALSVYENILSSGAEFSKTIHEKIIFQKENIEAAHEEVKSMLQLTKNLA